VVVWDVICNLVAGYHFRGSYCFHRQFRSRRWRQPVSPKRWSLFTKYITP